MNEQKPSCPKCKSTNLIVERRPDGDAQCLDCKWRGAYTECFLELSEQKPRQIWMQSKDLEFDLNWKNVLCAEFPHKDTMDGTTCFIEKSAYDALAARLAECEEALRFYANRLSWDFSGTFDKDGAQWDARHRGEGEYWVDERRLIHRSDASEHPAVGQITHGGKRAREYFAKWGGK